MSPTCIRADLLPGLLVPGLPVSADWTMVLDGDQEETIRVHGIVLKPIEEHEEDPRVLWWSDDPRIGLDNRAMMFLEVDVAHPMVRDRLVRWTAKGIPGRMPPMGLLCSMDPSPEELEMLGAVLRAMGAVLKDDPKAQIHLKDVHRMIADLGGPISDPTPGNAAMEVLEALVEQVSALEADVAELTAVAGLEAANPGFPEPDAAAVAAVCCNCGDAGAEETACTAREDGQHCVHWFEGDDSPSGRYDALEAARMTCLLRTGFGGAP